MSGCTSTGSSNMACDFIDGAAENALERDEDKGKSDIHGNRVKTNRNSDTEAGLMSILSGAFTRFMNSSESGNCE